MRKNQGNAAPSRDTWLSTCFSSRVNKQEAGLAKRKSREYLSTACVVIFSPQVVLGLLVIV